MSFHSEQCVMDNNTLKIFRELNEFLGDVKGNRPWERAGILQAIFDLVANDSQSKTLSRCTSGTS